MKKSLLTLLLAICFINNKAQILNTNFCQTNGIVYCTAVDSVNNIVYIGGNFSQVCGLPRNKLAAMNLTTGALLPWNPSPNNIVYSMYVHNKSLYVGGYFTSISGNAHKYVAKFNPSGTLTTWSPAITTGTYVSCIVATGSNVFIGGDILMTVGTGNNVCQLDTGTAVPIGWSAYPNGIVQSLSIDGNQLYVGGNYTQVGATAQSYLSKFYLSASGGSLSSWNPSPDNQVYALCAKSGRLFAGGAFSFIGSDNREKIAEIDTSTGFVTGWNPGADNTIMDIEYGKGNIYAIGNISTIGGASRGFIGAIDAITGVATSWNINANATIERIAICQSQIFLGGAFSSILGQTVNNFAVVCINPVAQLSSSPDGLTTVCNGQSAVTYSVPTVAGAASYVWSYSGTGATIHGTTNSITIDFSANATSGDLTVYGTNGCESSNTQTVSISTYSFTSTVSSNSNNITCGDSVDISSFDNYQGSGSITYSWIPATGLNATNVYKVTSGAKTSTTYTLTETSTEGCVAQDMTTITVSPFNLSASSSFGTILCSTKDTLHVTNDYTGFGTVTYNWTPSVSLNLPHSANPTATPTLSTDYTITASASDGCIGSSEDTYITVNPISLSTGSNSGNITCGDATQLNATNNYPGLGILTYSWSPSIGLSNPNVVGPAANPIVTTTYTLTLNSPEGCVSTDETTINVDPLQVTITNTVSAGCHSPVMLSTNANTTNANLTYSWTPSAGLNNSNTANPTAVVSQNTTYNITMSLPSSGCTDANNSVSISLTSPNTPQLCMVTVDSASTHNIVYWDKTSFANASIDSFRIYREITTNVYQIVGTVHYNALSQFDDYGANPNVTTYRYKLSALDSCGLESPLSNYHNTIFIVSNGNGQYTWNPLYTIENSPNPVDNYILMRDDNNTGLWHQVAITTGNQNTIVDPNYSTYQATANWQVVTAWNISCSPTARQSNGTQAAIVRSKSNITNNRTTGISNKNENAFSVYPNPTNGNVTISFASANKATIKITSMLGEEVYNETLTQVNDKHTLDLSKYQNGIYLLQVTTNGATTIKRIVKN